MDTTYKSSSFKRHCISFLLVVNYFLSRIHASIENVGHFFNHMVVYGRETGYIQLGVDESEADGRIRFRTVVENGVNLFAETNFRISNRWLAKGTKSCSGQLLWKIKTTLFVQDGLDGVDAHSVIWGSSCASRVEMSPFDLRRLPSEDIIAKQLAQKKRFQDMMAKWFPARPVKMGLTARDTARAIISRN